MPLGGSSKVNSSGKGTDQFKNHYVAARELRDEFRLIFVDTEYWFRA